MAAAEIERLRAEIGRFDTVEQRVEHTSRMLTEMTHGVGIAAAIPQRSPALDHVELVSLPGGPRADGGDDARPAGEQPRGDAG